MNFFNLTTAEIRTFRAILAGEDGGHSETTLKALKLRGLITEELETYDQGSFRRWRAAPGAAEAWHKRTLKI